MLDVFDQDERRNDIPNSLLKQDSMINMREWENSTRFDTSNDGIFNNDDAALYRGMSNQPNLLASANPLQLYEMNSNAKR